VDPLIGIMYPVERAAEAYEALKQDRRILLTLLTYTEEPSSPSSGVTLSLGSNPGVWKQPGNGPVGLALIGVGGFVTAMHIPSLRNMPAQFAVRMVVDQSGVAARRAASMLTGCRPTTSVNEALAADDVQAVLIGTRHNTHTELALRALRAGKAVFVEKPMCLTDPEFQELRATLLQTTAPFMVGYNRRFSPFAAKAKAALANRVNPVMLHYTMNAGYIPYDHWTQTEEGGGRIRGEACHIFDLFRFLVGAPAESVSVDALRPATSSVRSSDNVVATIRYADGSVATLLYTALGQNEYAKERMEVFVDGKTAVLDDYQILTIWGGPGGLRLRRQDKGHTAELQAWHAALISGERFPIPLDELLETWTVTQQTAGLAATDSR
jgi:predicted dehydrogenase